MNQKLFLNNCLIAIQVCFTQAIIAKEFNKPKLPKAVNSREIFLKGYQLEKLQADLPASSIRLDATDSLWICGQSALWKWTLHNNKLAKISLQKSKYSGPLRHLILSNGRAFTANKQQLFQIDFKPLKVVTYQISEDKDSESYLLSKSYHDILWTKSNGIFKVNPQTKKIVLWKKHSLKRPDALVFDHKSETLWLTYNKKLFTLNYRKKSPNLRLIYNTSQNIIGLKSHQNYLFAYTKNVMLIFDHDGSHIQSTPVNRNRSIRRLSIGPKFHTFLFDDELVERKMLSSQSSIFSSVKLKRLDQVQQMENSKSILAAISKGVPRAFQLEGTW